MVAQAILRVLLRPGRLPCRPIWPRGKGRNSPRKPSRRIEIRSSGIRAIREGTSLSQSEFARVIGVSVKTLQNWEQDRRHPSGPAAALLRIIAYEPQLAMKAIHRT